MAYNIINTHDYNPAHAIWYVMESMVGLSTDYMDSGSFLSVASTLYSEGRGISMLFDSQQPALTYIEEILKHINGILFHGTDRKLHLKLMRDDYVVDDLPTIDETMIESLTFRRGSFFHTINRVWVQFNELYNVGGWINHELTNPDAETGALTGWTTESGTPLVVATPDDEGEGYLGSGAISGSEDYVFTAEGLSEWSQEVDLVSDGVPADYIDNGNMNFKVTVWQGVDPNYVYQEAYAAAKIGIRCKDASKDELSTSWSSEWRISGSVLYSYKREYSVTMDVGTRYVDIILYAGQKRTILDLVTAKTSWDTRPI